MAIFMKYGSDKGEVSADGFKEWIELESFQWGVGRGISSGVGGASKREASTASISEVTVTKTLDSWSPLALKEAIGGKGAKVEIAITRTDENGAHHAFQKYTLEKTLVSGYSISSGGDRPSESLSLNFSKVDSEYVKIDEMYAEVTTGHVIYDIATSTLS